MNDELNALFRYDERKFRESLSIDGDNSATQDQLVTKIVIFTHILEKSLSNEDFEPGHGFDIVRYLVELIDIYNQKNYNKKSFGYTLALSVLQEFYGAHKGTEFIDQVEGIFQNTTKEVKKSKSNIGGVTTITYLSKIQNNEKNFADLSSGRYSVRTYSNRGVRKSDIEEAVEIATKTPTACNRQPVRVKAIYDNEIIEKILNIQGGLVGYSTPPCLLIITTDDSSYFGPIERNQGFIDGGLFSMSLLYALEYKKLGACPLNNMFNERDEKTIRGMLGIPENEKLIMFISCGYFNENSKVCKSIRYKAKDVLSEIDTVQDFILKEESLPQFDHIIKTQATELELLRKPGVKLATRKLFGSVRRKVYRTAGGGVNIIKSGVVGVRKVVKNHHVNVDGAIITICVYNNFGNILQRFALQEFLSQNNLKFDSVDMFDSSSEYAGYINHNFINFAEKYIKSVSFNQLLKTQYKNYIVGSDQVWRPEYLQDQKGGLHSFFFGFLKDKKARRLSYAASFGVDDFKDSGIDEMTVKGVRPLLQKFDTVSVREQSAVDLVNKIAGKEMHAKLVLDPTMLLDRSRYDAIIGDSTPDDKKLFNIFYFTFSNTPVYKNAISHIKKRYGNYSLDWPDSVEDWLRGIRDSKIVIAGSFHAVVFSIIFHTDFVLFEDKNNRNERVRHLLEILGINEDRIIADLDMSRKFDLDQQMPIDWVDVESRLTKLRQDSGGWLTGNIKGYK